MNIIGEVTVAIENQPNNTKLVANPTVGADVDLCAVLDIDNDVIGTLYTITGTFADAMDDAVSGALEAGPGIIIVADGTIDLYCAASNTGETKWILHYVPLDDDGSAVAI